MIISRNKIYENVLIAGGCDLIGREIVKALIKEDYNVSIGDIKNKKLNWVSLLPENKIIFARNILIKKY